MKNYAVKLFFAGLFAVLLAGCGQSTPEPTPKEVTDKMKADDAKHAAEMAEAVKKHDAESAAANPRGTTPQDTRR